MSFERQQTSLDMCCASCYGRRVVNVRVGAPATGRRRAKRSAVLVDIAREHDGGDPPPIVAKVLDERVQLIFAAAAGNDGGALCERRDDGARAEEAGGRQHEDGLAGLDADGVGSAHAGDDAGQLGHLVRCDAMPV